MISISAEKIFELNGLAVTNSMVNAWIAVAAFAAVGIFFRTKRLALVPRGFQNAVEALLEFMLSFMDQVTRDRARSKKFLPIVGTLFLFILLSNWMGLMPGVGTIGVWTMLHGETELVPLLRPATTDLNMTLAMGISAVIISHIFGVAASGPLAHANKFIKLGDIWTAIRKFGKIKPAQFAIGLFTSAVEFMVGIIELISEFAKVVSLSLRLFGNIFAGEVLLHVLSSLIAFVLPTPFMILELIVGAVQALVFSMLTLVYLTIATEKSHGAEAAREAHASA